MRPDPIGSPDGAPAGHTTPPGPRLPGGWAEGGYLPPRPNPSAPSGGGGRWFGRALLAAAAAALGAASLLARTEAAERDAATAELTSEFLAEACTP
jgi:hypothetical protein